jgi:hypothetical protein
VSQLVHQGDGGPAGDDGIDVHFLKHYAAVFDPPAGDLFQIADLGGGFGPAVRLDKAYRHVHALSAQAVSLLEHVEGLAHSGGETQVYFQPSALLTPDQI